MDKLSIIVAGFGAILVTAPALLLPEATSGVVLGVWTTAVIGFVMWVSGILAFILWSVQK